MKKTSKDKFFIIGFKIYYLKSFPKGTMKYFPLGTIAKNRRKIQKNII